MHGGDVYRNRIDLDFSVNVNPLGVPETVRLALQDSLTTVERYPDIHCSRLKNALAEHFHAGSDRILVGNGASELIYAVCRWRKPERALLAGPGFSGYERALAAAGCKVQVSLLDENDDFLPGEKFLQGVKNSDTDIIFLSNPANPTGVLMERTYLEHLAEICEEKNATLVVDECFMELTKEPGAFSLTEGDFLTRYKNLLVLRAFTKSFALPGIRLGYLLCGDARTAEEIAWQLPEWNVSGPAQAAGCAALLCEEHLAESVDVIEAEREYLSEELKALGYKVYPSKTNFILFKDPDEMNRDRDRSGACDSNAGDTDEPAEEIRGRLYDSLLAGGILIRDCSDYAGLTRGFYRVAVRTREENNRLLQAMKSLKG